MDDVLGVHPSGFGKPGRPVIGKGKLVARVGDEPDDPIKGHGPHEVRTYVGLAASRHAVSALDALLQFIDGSALLGVSICWQDIHFQCMSTAQIGLVPGVQGSGKLRKKFR
jgi:hypothetical protein